MADAVHEHPLAVLLGIEGLALQRATTGHGRHGREFVERRLAEVRRLLDDPRLRGGLDVGRVPPGEGYAEWSRRYDVPDTAFGDPRRLRRPPRPDSPGLDPVLSRPRRGTRRVRGFVHTVGVQLRAALSAGL